MIICNLKNMFQSKFIFNLKSLIFVSEKTKIDRTKNLLKLGPPIIASRNFESNNFALIAISAVPRRASTQLVLLLSRRRDQKTQNSHISGVEMCQIGRAHV